MTSRGQWEVAQEARQADIAVSLTKPIHQSQLFKCLITVMQLSPPQNEPRPAAPPFSAKAQVPPLGPRPLILVVEDNIINQKLAMRLLEKMGYRADVAADGLEALSALSSIPYAAVLMDCQMPNMDGFEATRIIRQREASHHAPSHVPIIAMTANAMEGDRERCLAAGMDDYIAKPVKSVDLKVILEHWIAKPEVGQEHGPDIRDAM